MITIGNSFWPVGNKNLLAPTKASNALSTESNANKRTIFEFSNRNFQFFILFPNYKHQNH